MSEPDLYRVLQVDAEADSEVIQAAYGVLAQRLHPESDLTGVDEVRMVELERARGILTDLAQRRAYDLRRAAQLVAMGPGRDAAQHVSVTLTDRLSARTVDGDSAAALQIDFGRYTGWTLGDLVRADPDYLRWLSRHSSGIRYRGAILRLLADHDDHHRKPRTPATTER